MTQNNLILLALKKLDCSQKELGKMLDVSPTQISLWKKGESMSENKISSLKIILSISDSSEDEDLLNHVNGDKIEYKRWLNFFKAIARDASEDIESMTVTVVESDGRDIEDCIIPSFLYSCERSGFKLPQKLPDYIPVDFSADSKFDEKINDRIYNEPFTKIIRATFSAMVSIEDYHGLFLSDLTDDFDNLEISMNTTSYSFIRGVKEYARDMITNENMPTFQEYFNEIYKLMKSQINLVKKLSFEKNVPIKTEFMDFITEDLDHLYDVCEQNHFRMKRSIHPDIYMNELIVTGRENNKLLKAIAEKLDIKI